MAKYLLGSDPEMFVVDTVGNFLSGHLFPCGTKMEPRKTTHGFVQVDGIALEFNTIPTCHKDEFIANIKNVVRDLNAIVSEQYPGAMLKAFPTAEVGREFLSRVPFENAELGCNPDFNAYSLQPNPSPDSDTPFRTGSGHVHVGFCEPDPANLDDLQHFEKSATVARQLDYFLGLPSLMWDGDNRRRALYGQAGAFRPKPYGMEYRVLSNKWVDDESLCSFVFDQTQKALERLDAGDDFGRRYGDFARAMIADANVNWRDLRPDIASEVM